MTADAEALAQRLLDAQVAYLARELSGERLVAVVTSELDSLLQLAETVPLGTVLRRDAVKATAREVVLGQAGGSTLVARMVRGVADAIYQLAANDHHTLGEVIDREAVSVLVGKVVSMQATHDEILRRLGESPVVASVASWFVARLISDVFEHNREVAERVPGVSSLLKLGGRAAGRVRGTRSRHFDEVVGDAAGRGAQRALRRVLAAMRHTVAEAPMHDAAMEIWDFHAEDTISGLKEYLSGADFRELAEIGFEIWLILRETEYFATMVDAWIDVLFDEHEATPVAVFLRELGLGRDHVVADVLRYAPAVVDALHQEGWIEQLLRRRLAPFFASPAVLEALTCQGEVAH